MYQNVFVSYPSFKTVTRQPDRESYLNVIDGRSVRQTETELPSHNTEVLFLPSQFPEAETAPTARVCSITSLNPKPHPHPGLRPSTYLACPPCQTPSPREAASCDTPVPSIPGSRESTQRTWAARVVCTLLAEMALKYAVAPARPMSILSPRSQQVVVTERRLLCVCLPLVRMLHVAGTRCCVERREENMETRGTAGSNSCEVAAPGSACMTEH